MALDANTRRDVEDLIDQRVESPRHAAADHLDRGMLVSKLTPGAAGSFARSVGGDAVWDTTDMTTQAEFDAAAVKLTGDQTVAGIKTFSSIPVLPASDPTTANQAVRRSFAVGLPSVISERASRCAAALAATPVFHVVGHSYEVMTTGTAGASVGNFYIDPADWGASGVRVKVRGWVQTEVDPTDSTVTFRLCRETGAPAGGAIAAAASTIADAVVTANLANTQTNALSPEVTVTTAGMYFVMFVHSVAPTQRMTYGYTVMGRPA